MMQVGTFIEVPFGGTGKEAQSAIGELFLIVLPDEPVLLMYDAVMSASLLTKQPCSMESSGNLDSKVVILLLFLIASLSLIEGYR